MEDNRLVAKLLKKNNSVSFRSEGRINTFLQKDRIHDLC